MCTQTNRLACLNAIRTCYLERPGLLADRWDGTIYWSVWSYGDNRLLEVVKTREEISIFEYVSID